MPISISVSDSSIPACLPPAPCRLNSHAHGADVGDDLFRRGLDFFQARAFGGLGPGDFMHENRAGYAAPSRRVQAVLDGYVVVDET